MLGGTLVCFHVVTIYRFRGRSTFTKQQLIIFGMPNARMSSYP
jgi:hypothetical protein